MAQADRNAAAAHVDTAARVRTLPRPEPIAVLPPNEPGK